MLTLTQRRSAPAASTRNNEQIDMSSTAAAPAPAAAPSSAPSPTSDPTRRHAVGISLWLIGILLLGFVGYLAVFSGLQENRSQNVLEDKVRYELAHGTAPAVPVQAGQPVAVLTIPRLRIRDVIVDGATSRDLMAGPGVLAGSVLPGQVGNSFILGRRATFGAPFAKLGSLHVGDQIQVASAAGQLIYTVDGIWHNDHSFSEPSANARLTLWTSDPSWHPHRVLEVTAALTRGTPQTPTVAPTQIQPAPLRALDTDHSSALSLYLWAQLAFIAVLALLRFHDRVRRSVLWVAGMPFLLVVLWHVYPDLASLLPNTL